MKIDFKIVQIELGYPVENIDSFKFGQTEFESICADFEFYVGDHLQLSSPYWNVVELALQLLEWKRYALSGEFRYHCMDADDAALFSFDPAGDGFTFSSEWSDSNPSAIIDNGEVRKFIDSYALSVKYHIEHHMKGDWSGLVKQLDS